MAVLRLESSGLVLSLPLSSLCLSLSQKGPSLEAEANFFEYNV